MRRKERDTATQAEHVCPACDHPVTTVIKRHKTLGIFVPAWVAGPCHNPDCREHVPDVAERPDADEPGR
ncbi:hypothetical protein [Streptomyces sp. H27-D2]|uniref:hypothetical protein n=1 Tax=Streptomyces sp. H27-D2 TaxID=3046304 RepID=UPI002DC03DAF|nr:hypothetical protein [Streptomyces sp. H27-D2]MEC4015364.1 hypothetical protein [Streptomyces sp. H27-D2]